MKNNKGFTLIEVLIYIALFSLLMGTAFMTAFNLIDGSGKLSAKTTTIEEGNFVLRKINWALTGISSDTADIVNPPKVFPYTNSTLSIKKWQSGTKVPIEIAYDAVSNRIMMRKGGGPPLPITTANVKVTNLQFEFIPSVQSGPAGIKATATIDGKDFSITKYIRQ